MKRRVSQKHLKEIFDSTADKKCSFRRWRNEVIRDLVLDYKDALEEIKNLKLRLEKPSLEEEIYFLEKE